jgi:hypothetical protein
MEDFSTLTVHPDVEQDRLPIDVQRMTGANPQGRYLAAITDVGLLARGTGNGTPVVAFLIELPNGRQVVAETTWELLRTAVRALQASPIAREAEAQQ